MMLLRDWFIGVLATACLLLLPSCKKDQPGCTVENCKAMEACALHFDPGLPSACSFYRPLDGGVGFEVLAAKYCVEQCNAFEEGPSTACIARVAPTTDHCATDPGLAQISNECFADAGGGVEPQKSCDDACRAEKATCDDRCSGGSACIRCWQAGGSADGGCNSACPATGREGCVDCSLECFQKYAACSDSCPREQ